MSQSEIDLEQIQRRLGSHNGSLFGAEKSSDETDDYSFISINSEKPEPTLSFGFVATVLVLFLGVGSGTYFFMEGGIRLPEFRLPWSGQGEDGSYFSSVEGQCIKGWRKGASNVDQMHCFLSTSISRLCEPEERQALVATIQRFQQDSLGGDLQLASKVETVNASSTNGGGMSASGNNSGEALDAKPDYQLAFDVTALAARGYINVQDFGPDQPQWVRRGFGEVRAVSSRCPQSG